MWFAIFHAKNASLRKLGTSADINIAKKNCNKKLYIFWIHSFVNSFYLWLILGLCPRVVVNLDLQEEYLNLIKIMRSGGKLGATRGIIIIDKDVQIKAKESSKAHFDVFTLGTLLHYQDNCSFVETLARLLLSCNAFYFWRIFRRLFSSKDQ